MRTFSRVTRGRLVAEAANGVLRRPLRSALTALGTALGVGAFVAVLGLTSTANSQVSRAFTARDATEVKIATADDGGVTLPADAETSVRQVRGTVGAGMFATSGLSVARSPGTGSEPASAFVTIGVTAQYWTTVEPDLAAGRIFDAALEARAVAVIGQRLADAYGIDDLSVQPLISIGGERFLVIGILRGADRESAALLTAAAVPLGYVHQHDLLARDQLIVTTRLGAAESTARQAPTAIDPFDPGGAVATFTPRSTVVDDEVSDRLRTLFIALAGVCLVVGAVGIANVALVSVMERTAEIGLRRALGALRRHVLIQFLLEAAFLGAAGGLAGGVAGQMVVVVAALANNWTPVLSGWVLLGSVPAGLAVGALAGLYPAARAARVEPVEALRR